MIVQMDNQKRTVRYSARQRARAIPILSFIHHKVSIITTQWVLNHSDKYISHHLPKTPNDSQEKDLSLHGIKNVVFVSETLRVCSLQHELNS